MCHLILLLPIAGLPLFWLLPLGYALPINGGILLTSVFLYWLMMKAMKKPIQDGFQSLVSTEAEVVSKLETGRSAKYLVRAKGEGELWSANSSDALEIGEWVNIVAVKGIGVIVERTENGSRPDEIGNAKTITSGARDNRQHCH